MRRPLERGAAHAGASGSHHGIETANVPWEIYVASSNGDSIDVSTYVALHTTIDLDGLYDLLEMAEVHASWANAAYLNAKEAAEREGAG
jgi:hypothetical protein